MAVYCYIAGKNKHNFRKMEGREEKEIVLTECTAIGPPLQPQWTHPVVVGRHSSVTREL